MTCLITGTARLPSGALLPGAVFIFKRSPYTLTAQAASVVPPRVITAMADASGFVSFTLLPGNYSATESTTGVRFSLAVPDLSTMNFADGVNAASIPPIITPASTKVSVPASAAAAGVPGWWAADAAFVYFYTGDGITHTWRRAATAAW